MLNLKNISIGFLLSLILYVFLSQQTFKSPSAGEIDKRIHYLERIIFEDLDSNSEIVQLGYVNYEWMLFSYSYSTFALANLSKQDSSLTKKVIPIIKEAITKVMQKPIYSPYNIDIEKLDSDSIPEYSVLYLAHLNLMLGTYRQLSTDTAFHQLNDRISASLYQRYSNSNYLSLESYPSSIWIPDNTVAISSLHLHSKITGSLYQSIVDSWIDFTRNNYVEPHTGTLYSMINPENGTPFEEPRGSMLGWSIMFISQFEPDFARELYSNYKLHFSTNLGMYQPFKERYNVSNTDIGDIDSGPILFGYNIPANEFALSGAIFTGDLKTAKRIERLIDFGTSKQIKHDELYYETLFIDFKISPMAEALVLYSLSTIAYDQN
jgi:hypothetical protein